jgi:hypothetical protein
MTNNPDIYKGQSFDGQPFFPPIISCYLRVCLQLVSASGHLGTWDLSLLDHRVYLQLVTLPLYLSLQLGIWGVILGVGSWACWIIECTFSWLLSPCICPFSWVFGGLFWVLDLGLVGS